MCDQGDQHVPEGARELCFSLHSDPDSLPAPRLLTLRFAHHVAGGSHGHVSSLGMEMEAVVAWIYILPLISSDP